MEDENLTKLRSRRRRSSILTFHPRVAPKPSQSFPPVLPPHNALVGFGTQTSSMRQSEPIYSIPRQERQVYEKTYISAEHSARLPSNYTREVSYFPKNDNHAPMNQNYAYGTQMGRPHDTKVTFFPAEKIYERRSMFGHQLSSMKTSEPGYSIGKDTREKQQRLFISHQHSKARVGFESPGPAAILGQVSSIGRQPNSLRNSEPRATIGKGSRWEPEQRLKVPGPGAYFK